MEGVLLLAGSCVGLGAVALPGDPNFRFGSD